MSFFQFHSPITLYLLLLLPIIAWWSGRIGQEASLRFSSTHLIKALDQRRQSRPGRWLVTLRLLALTAIIFALARPQIGRVTDSTEADGIDIVITLDLSGSMRALDLSTRDNIVTRLDAAKGVVDDFITKRPFDRTGLVAFAAEAYVVSPLTLNHDWLRRNLDRLDLGMIDGGGTAIGTALSASFNRLRDHQARSPIVILLSDGENNAGAISPLAAAEVARTLGIKVYTIATGRQGRVPIAEMDRSGRILRDNDGNPIYRGRSELSSFDTTELKEIASITGGRFFEATAEGELERIYREIDQLETTKVELRSFATFSELFFWPALLGLALLVVEQILAHTRYRRLP